MKDETEAEARVDVERRDLVQRAARAYLAAEEPDQLEEFDLIFPITYSMLDGSEESFPEVRWSQGGLQADSSFPGDPVPSAAVVWIVAEVVGAVSRQGLDLEEIPELVKSLARFTGNVERSEGIIRSLVEMTSELRRLRRAVEKLDRSQLAQAPPAGSAEDLLFRVRTRYVRGGVVLDYELSSPSGAFDIQTIRDESRLLRMGDLERSHAEILSGLERLLEGAGRGGEIFLRQEIEKELRYLGQDLYLRLLGDKVQGFLREFRTRIGAMLVVADDPWIPWELFHPGDEDADFLCMLFPMARWLGEGHGPTRRLRIERLLALVSSDAEPLPPLAATESERELFESMAREVPGLEALVLAPARFDEVVKELEEGSWDCIHFAGHADQDQNSADHSRLELEDRPLRASQLVAGIQGRISKYRPLIFLNGCRSGREGTALTGVGGWPDRLVRLCKCGALLSPQWAIRDLSAAEFSRVVYERLRERSTLGEAVLEARRALRRREPSDPTYLAYSLYGHPNAEIVLGSAR